MNNGELKTKLLNWSHRSDLASEVQGFINGATERINQRFGTKYNAMSADADSNQTLADHGETLYFYAAARELNVYIQDMDTAARFDELFDKEASRMNIHVRLDGWVTDATALTHVRNELETQAIEEQINAG